MENSTEGEARHEPDEVGRRLKFAREYRGLTQEELANRSGVARATISQVETGARAGLNLSFGTVIKLAVALEVMLDFVGGLWDYPPPGSGPPGQQWVLPGPGGMVADIVRRLEQLLKGHSSRDDPPWTRDAEHFPHLERSIAWLSPRTTLLWWWTMIPV
jgi:transcriptional regulator with XRE-family HTH domain